jgi:Xaa-Pro aminopeptidase
MFSKETYIARRKKLKETVSSGVLLFLGNELSAMNYVDNTYSFRQDSTFLYYFGIDQEGLSAIIDLDEDKEIIFGDELSIDHIIWMGNLPTLKERAEAVGAETRTSAELATCLQGRKVHYLPPYRPEHQIKLSNWLSMSINEVNTGVSEEMLVAISEQRIIKSSEEIAEMDDAASITADMHLTAMRFARPGMTEAQVAAKVREVALAQGNDVSFPIIATINGQTLHNHYHGNTIAEGDLFLLDTGASNKMHYAGDMTRTFPVGSKFTEKQKAVYEIVLEAFYESLNVLKPGVNYKEAHFAACETIFDGLKGLGITKGDTKEAVQNGAHALFMPHGVGHLLGLDVHDMENFGEEYVGYAGEKKSSQFGLKSLRLGRTLKTGFAVTIEPGIYFIPELINVWKADNLHAEFINFDKLTDYLDFGGIRIEEDAVVTENGYKVLGKPLAKTVDEVETERAKAFDL